MNRKTAIALGGITVIVIAIIVTLSVVYSNKNKNESQNQVAETQENADSNIVAGESDQSLPQTNLDDFAKYLTAQGFVVYGSFTCPHCTDQKEVFGSSFQYIKYIECNSRGPNPNPQACTDAGIEGVPTWVKDGIKYEGFKSIDELKKISNYQN